jgi:hypothetical protein
MACHNTQFDPGTNVPFGKVTLVMLFGSFGTAAVYLVMHAWWIIAWCVGAIVMLGFVLQARETGGSRNP